MSGQGASDRGQSPDPGCKHCGEQLMADGHRHDSGPQKGMNRCAVEPYGFNGAHVGVDCDPTCYGSEPEPPTITKIYR